jgi:hypothetical protein
VTAEARAHVRFRRAIERRALWAAEDAAREMPNLPLEDAVQLVHLYAERGSPKYERAATRSSNDFELGSGVLCSFPLCRHGVVACLVGCRLLLRWFLSG